MVKTFYVMRHGQTRFNLQGRIQGACDSPLTELGIEQAKSARQHFKEGALRLHVSILRRRNVLVILLN